MLWNWDCKLWANSSASSHLTDVLRFPSQNGSPAIQVDPLLCEQGVVTFNPMCLQPGEAETVAAAVRRFLLS